MDRLSNVIFVFSVAGNELGPEGAKILTDMLSVSRSMTSIDLSSNNLGEVSARLLPGWEDALQGKMVEFDTDNDGAFNDVELGNFLLAMQGLEAGSVPEDQLAEDVQAFKKDLAQDTKNLDQNGNVSIMGLMSMFSSQGGNEDGPDPVQVGSMLATVGLGEDWVQEKPWGIIAIADALSVSSSMNSLQ